MRQFGTSALAVLIMGLGICQSGIAGEPDEWQFEVTPYLLAAGMEGTAGVRGHWSGWFRSDLSDNGRD